ncbi:antibiotic biosynthesis monooxygenase family protein [Bradyrhizobium guangdongense]|uniref:antibiotic biosynthesis monooxygenase family protein n=1 Tax=Bradyrhizobium guangdongense TaxID=1325090 RepID=UPI001642BE6A|nr:antibiotic biosynthesis monooxygenase [Bradyrhizobium guangdongense]
MIARIWRATATHENAADYQRHFASRIVPHLKAINGFSGAKLLRRESHDGIELLAMTLWQSLDSVRSFTGPDPERAVIDADAQAMLSTCDETAANYEIVVDELRA